MTTKRGETAAILPSESKPIRTEPMTDAELWELLAAERREIEAAGRVLHDPECMAAREKAQRIAQANR